MISPFSQSLDTISYHGKIIYQKLPKFHRLNGGNISQKISTRLFTPIANPILALV
jgi:hypothetical protein